MRFRRGLWVFPVPPLEAFGIGTLLRGEIDGAAKNIENASILMLIAKSAKSLIQSFRAPTTQIGHAADAKISQVLGQTRANARNAPKIT
jgi:hypothetical protein